MLESDLLYLFGATALGVLFLFYFYYFIRFKIQLIKTLKSYEKMDIESERVMKFGFDDNGIFVESANSSRTIGWTLIKKYEINGDEIYLYLANQSLYDIISKSIIGDLFYKQFLQKLKEKVG